MPRSEYPRPQFTRDEWLCLNGRWSYEFDFARTGLERQLPQSKGFDKDIIVPFCPESLLSGVEYKDFIEAMWYHRKINIPHEWHDRMIFLNFGAVDFHAQVFIDGHCVGTHWGGGSSFGFDISDYVQAGGQHDLVVYVIDETRNPAQPSGKQSPRYNSYECFYSRVTGIWQSVWLEPMHKHALKRCRVLTDIDNNQITFLPEYYQVKTGCHLQVTLLEDDKKIAEGQTLTGPGTSLTLKIDNPRLWSPDDAFLYEIEYEVIDRLGRVVDKVTSYTGLRKIHIEDDRIYLNNKPLFQRLVLDQGYYPDGIWTAPSDDALKHDIQLSLDAGFNGARLHQKVFEERFLYWADRMGYLVWAESASWGCDTNIRESSSNFLSEWSEIVIRDRNHPSIITWTPFNETWERRKDDGVLHDKILIAAYDLTHKLDGTRPVNDTSGHFHARTDLWTVHIYDQQPEELQANLLAEDGQVFLKNPEWEAKAYRNQPYILAEFGGIKWSPTDVKKDEKRTHSWGYGNTPDDIEEFYKRLESLVDVALSSNKLAGYCYTQLTDVEQEQNGIYRYDRTAKFDMKRIKRIFQKLPTWQQKTSAINPEKDNIPKSNRNLEYQPK